MASVRRQSLAAGVGDIRSAFAREAVARAGFPVSVAEVGFQELWQRGRIAVAHVSTDPRLSGSILDRIAGMIGSDGEIELVGSRIEVVVLDEEHA